jgi:putative sterol carrier protein
MTDPTAEFFDALQRQGTIPLMEKVDGTLRFDVVDGDSSEHWFVTVDGGKVALSRENSAADCVVRADRRLIEGVWEGEVNAFAAVLRGEIEVEGDTELMVLFQRLLPGPGATAATPAGSRS